MGPNYGQQSSCWLESAWPFAPPNLPGQYWPLNSGSLSSGAAALRPPCRGRRRACKASSSWTSLGRLKFKLNLLQTFKLQGCWSQSFEASTSDHTWQISSWSFLKAEAIICNPAAARARAARRAAEHLGMQLHVQVIWSRTGCLPALELGLLYSFWRCSKTAMPTKRAENFQNKIRLKYCNFQIKSGSESHLPM